jgi:hypothetical protein
MTTNNNTSPAAHAAPATEAGITTHTSACDLD